jgi:hypothetical protein
LLPQPQQLPALICFLFGQSGCCEATHRAPSTQYALPRHTQAACACHTHCVAGCPTACWQQALLCHNACTGCVVKYGWRCLGRPLLPQADKGVKARTCHSGSTYQWAIANCWIGNGPLIGLGHACDTCDHACTTCMLSKHAHSSHKQACEIAFVVPHVTWAQPFDMGY